MGVIFLSDLKLNECCEFVEYDVSIPLNIKRRMLELGFVSGVKVRLLQLSFLNDVMLVELNGYTLSLRKNIAQKMICRRLNCERNNFDW